MKSGGLWGMGVEEATVVCRQLGLPTDGQRPI